LEKDQDVASHQLLQTCGVLIEDKNDITLSVSDQSARARPRSPIGSEDLPLLRVARILEAFYAIKASGGLGKGLSICRSIAQGGRLRATPNEP
jgi:signal transduction histidine kinase